MPLLTSIIQKIAPQIGAVVFVDSEHDFVGYVAFKNGNKAFFNERRLSINRVSSAEIAKDKGYSKFFLKQFGYNVTEGQTFFSHKLCEKLGMTRDIDAGFEYGKNLGFPLIVKPINLSHGKLVVKIYNKTEYYQVAKKILRVSSGFIIEKFYTGKDYRIVVIDNEIMAAYQRLPLSVIGDGQSSILELLEQKQKLFIENVREKIIDCDDFRIKRKLKKQNLNLKSIISNGKIIYLLDNANLSSGGEAIDFTENIHPDFKKLALNVTKDMGLRLMGLDILAQDITQPISEPMSDYVIIEINSSPGLMHYASMGDAQIRRVEDLYLKMLKALETEYDNNN